MSEFGYGRIRDLGGLPELLRAQAGEEGLRRAFHYQDLPFSLLQIPDQLVPVRDLVGLYQHAANITGIRSFGLIASTAIDLNEHGPVGQYIIQGANLGQALSRFRIALPYHETGSEFFVEDGGDNYVLCYRNDYQDINGWRHAGDFTLSVIGSILDHYLGKDWRPIQIETCYPHGKWEQDLEDLFQAPVTTGTNRVAITIAKDLLATEQSPRAEISSNIITLSDVLNYGRSIPHDFSAVLINVIDRQIADRSLSLDHTAALLGLSRRTLQRRLGEENLTFRDLTWRRSMHRAAELLADDQLTVAQVANQVDYSHPPQFIRVFKKAFGVTPSQFRQIPK